MNDFAEEHLQCEQTSDGPDEDAEDSGQEAQAAALMTQLLQKQASRRMAEVNVERTSKNSKKVTQYTLNMLNFIPNTILFELSKLQTKKDLPICYKYRTVVILAELRSFYDTDRISRGSFADEPMLNEHLTTVSNKFLETCSHSLVKYGGDLIQFLGTAMIGIFTEAAEQDVAKRATACALEIQNECATAFRAIELQDRKDAEPTKYPICFGLGYGDAQVLHVGGILNRVEFFVAGQALVRAFAALKLADGPAQNICVSGEMWPLIQDDIEGERTKHLKEQVTFLSAQRPKVRLEDPKPEELRFYFISKAKKEILPARDMVLQKVRNSEELISKFQLQLKYYIPGSYRHASQFKDIDKVSGAHEKQTVVAIAIEMSINEGRTKSQTSNHQLLQSFIQVVQAQVYKMEGSFAKVFSYESGVIILATWGMHLLSHYDDCSRAVLAAINIKKHLTQLQLDMELEEDSFVEPPVHIGIATGDVFQGIIGGINRREVVGIGETKERALALLQVAYSHYSKIYVDFTTKQMASHTMDFEFIEHVEQQDRVLNLAVFRPRQDFSEEYSSGRNDKNMARKQASQIRIHSNPFFYDRDNSYLKSFSKMQGRSSLLHDVFSDIDEYIQNYDQDSCWVLAIKGEIGCGKSLFARKLILELAEQEKTIFRTLNLTYPKLHFQFLATSSDCLKQTKFVGIWRPFLRHLLTMYAEECDQTREYIISTQIQHTKAIEDKIHTIEEIFGVQNLAKKQHYKPQHADPLNMGRERFHPEYEDILTVFCVDFIQHTLEALKEKCCYVVVFDNAENMNLSSWRLFDLVQANCRYMVLIMVIQKDNRYFEEAPENKVSNQGFKIDQNQDTLQYYMDFIKPKEKQIFSVVEIPPLTTDNLLHALIQMSPVYERTMNQEIEFLTQVLNPKTTNKTYAEVKDATIRLISQYQVYQHFDKVDEEVLQLVIQQSNGKALVAFYLVFQAIVQGLITVENNQLIASSKFRASATLLLPYEIQKQMIVRFEHALKDSHKSMPKLSMTQMVQLTEVLSSASVVGDTFSQNLLDHAHNVKVDRAKQIRTAELLQMAQDRDLIELIHVDEPNNDFFYRFTDAHMRSAIYQTLAFKGVKQEIHQSIVKYHQDKVVLDITNKYSLDQLYTYFQSHIFRLEKKTAEDLLSAHSRQLLQIKRIMHAERERERLKQGQVRLTSDNKTEIVMANLTLKALEFYVELKPGTKKYSRFCTIELRHIKNIEAHQEIEDDPDIDNGFRFRLTVSQWQKAEKVNGDLLVRKSDQITLAQMPGGKDKREQNKARVEAENWLTAIEFLTTRKNFESFRNRYGSFQFRQNTDPPTKGEGHQRFKSLGKEPVSKQIKSRMLVQHAKRPSQTESENQSRLQHSRIQYQTTEHKRIEIQELSKKLQCLYNFGFLQFTAHLSDQSQALSMVKPRLCQPLIENKAKQLLQLSDIGDFIDEPSRDSKCGDDNPEGQEQLLSFEKDPDQQQQEAQVVGQFDLPPSQPIWTEEHHITSLCVTNWEWQEGQKVAGTVDSELQTSNQEFKLRRRDDALGYNKMLSPYRSQVDLLTQNHRGIQGMMLDEKSPNKSRKTKAENIQKILENSNSPWFLNYMNSIKNRPLIVKQESPQNFDKPETKPSPKVQERRSTIINNAGGLKQSMSLNSISQHQSEAQRRMTLKTVAFSKNVKQNMLETGVGQKHGDNLLSQLVDSDEKPSVGFLNSSVASFHDYKYSERVESRFIVGCPATFVNSQPQYIGDTRLNLKKGDVVYLSKEVTTDDPVINCHTFDRAGNKLELIVGRNELRLESDTSSSEVLMPDRAQRIYQGNAVRIKEIKSIDSLLNHQEISMSSDSAKGGQDVTIHPQCSTRKQLDENLQRVEQTSLFKKVQERSAAKLLREQLFKSQQKTETPNRESQQQLTQSQVESTKKTPKVMERMRKKQQQLQL